MSREKRKNLIQVIEQKRGSKVITYITSDRENLSSHIKGDAVSILHEHILAIKPEERKKLDLFIYSPGGEADVPWTIVSMFREYTDSFSLLIPYRAQSAATLLSLGADELVMTKMAELGPIDPITWGPFNPTTKDSARHLSVPAEYVMGFFTLLEKIGCGRAEEKIKGFEQLTREVHPLCLGEINRALLQTELVALRLLETRKKPFPKEKNREIVKHLSSEIYSHRHTIHRTEAKNCIGLDQVVSAEDAKIEDDLWALYEEYRTFFSLDDPFPEPTEYMTINDLDKHTWENLKVECIESECRFDVKQFDLKIKRIRQFPTAESLQQSNLSFPALNIPALPSEVTSQDLREMMEQLLQKMWDEAVNKAVDRLIKSLPTEFEDYTYNIAWKKEA